MGARRPGDTHLLCEVARPTVAVVTNVGLAHIEVFGSWESIVEASAEPVEALPNEGVAVLFADDPIVLGYARRTSARVVTFGVSADADVRARNVRLDPEGRPSFELTAGDEREHTELAVVGEHMVANALAATACGIVLGMSPAECAAGLKGARVSPWRMETFTSRDGIRVLNDAYNANPESTAAALRTARRMARGAGLVAVLGTMAELGVVSVEQHTRIGALAARIGVERLIVVGADARPIADAAVREGMDPQHIATLDDHEEALEDVLAHARPGDVVLLKASRVVGLERMARALR
jgi:UDP-N-acetylmuramoyl-tripeptide--D-alanyl-D-alanine ligase